VKPLQTQWVLILLLQSYSLGTHRNPVYRGVNYTRRLAEVWRDRESASSKNSCQSVWRDDADRAEGASDDRAERNGKPQGRGELTKSLRIGKVRQKKRDQDFTREVISWQRAKRIREYIAAVREEATGNTDADAERRLRNRFNGPSVKPTDRSVEASPHSIVDERKKSPRLRSVEGYTGRSQSLKRTCESRGKCPLPCSHPILVTSTVPRQKTLVQKPEP